MRSVKKNHVTLFLFFVPKSKSIVRYLCHSYVPNFTPRRTLPDM